MRRSALFLTVVLFTTASAVAASACDFALSPDPVEREAQARASLDQMAAVVDVEVVRAPSPGRPALVRAVRVLRGPAVEMFEIAPQRHSCDAGIGPVGSHQRLFLTGGPTLWNAVDLFADERDVDRLLGSERRYDDPRLVPPAGGRP